MSKITNFAVLILSCFVLGINAKHWSYEDISEWPKLCHTGQKQSPININEDTAIVKTFEKFNFKNYHIDLKATILNNGHSVALKTSEMVTVPKLSGGGLEKVYVFDHLHFHWGGSEHTVNNYRFPLEVHFVHYAEEYKNLWSALQQPGGVAVLGALYDVSPDDDAELEPFIKGVEDVEEHLEAIRPIDSIELRSFMPRDVAGFYRYEGSLTTPNCTESIIWTVFSNTLPISNKQLKHFKTVHSAVGILRSNYRPIQKLNERKVYRKVSPLPHNSSGIPNSKYVLLVLLTCFFTRIIF